MSLNSRRTVFGVRSYNRHVCDVTVATPSHYPNGRSELDSHADTVCCGKGWRRYHDTNTVADVDGYAEGLVTANVPISHCITAYTQPYTGETVILQSNWSLHMGDKMETSLFSTAQLRDNGVIVEDVPSYIDNNSRHMLQIPTGDGSEHFTIPLELSGVFSGFSHRLPTQEEMDTCRWIHLTSAECWNPGSNKFREKEESYKTHHTFTDASRTVASLRTQCTSHHQVVVSEDSGLDLAYEMYTRPVIASTYTSKPRGKWKAEDVARTLGVGIDTATRTLEATTQKILRQSVFNNNELTRRYRTHHPDQRRHRIYSQFYTDVMKAGVKSVHGDKYANIFVNDSKYSRFYPIQSKSDVRETLDCFVNDVGIPDRIHADNAPEYAGKDSEFAKRCRYYGIFQTFTEPYSPWQNRAEVEIREVKRGIRRRIRKTGAHPRLWNYAGAWVSETRCITAFPDPRLKGRTPYELIHGHTPDISQYLEFDWYDRCFYERGKETMLGRVIGVAHNHGQDMCYYVLAKSGKVVSTSFVKRVNPDKFVEADWTDYDRSITDYLGKATKNDMPFILPPDLVDPLMDDSDELVIPMEPEAMTKDREDYTPEECDTYINAVIMLPSGDKIRKGTVTKRKRDHDGNPIGKENNNPKLDSREYIVTFEDGHEEELMANTIAVAIHSRTDSDGRERLVIDEIMDHRRTTPPQKGKRKEHGDRLSGKETRKVTKGWKFLLAFKDGSTGWFRLADLLREYPVELAKYVIDNQLQDEDAFAWWVHKTVAQHQRIISKVKSKYWNKTHMFGIELPKTYADCERLDRESGTDHWKKAIEKEMKACRVAFKILEDTEDLPVGCKEITCHMTYIIKMGTLQRKARYVAGGHLYDSQASGVSTYSSVVSRDTVRLLFLIASLNNLEVSAGDISNAFLNAKPKENAYFIAGDEFGPKYKGKRVLIVRALYGLAGSASAFRNHVIDTLTDPAAGFENCIADPDAWRRPARKKDGTLYYEYILVYVDDILIASENPSAIHKLFEETYDMKSDKEGRKWSEPDRYLGATIEKWSLANSKSTYWAMSGREYIEAAVSNVETYLEKQGLKLYTNVTTPMQTGYRPELDVSTELDLDQTRYYQELMGILRWITECGRIDILHELSLLSKHNCMPRKGHLEQVFRIFAYLKHNPKKKIVFDPRMLSLEPSRFKKVDWSEHYPDAKDEKPPKMPEPRGAEVQINAFVDADHAGDKVNRRSHTGIIIFVNRAPIVWYSKKQNSVETSTFSSELVALRTATEMIKALQYKLRMMGVPIVGAANVFCDNESVTKSASIPESTLKKKHNAICFHMVREACAAGVLRVAWEPTGWNLADALTKVHPAPVRNRLFVYMKNSDHTI